MRTDGDTPAFRPVRENDLAMIGRWMREPHWRQWWGEPETELGYIRDMLEGRDTTRPFLFTVNDEPRGYIQYWFIRDARVEPWVSHAPWVMELPDDAIGVDLSIGPAQWLGRGLGSRALWKFARQLNAAGHATIIIDPDIANTRAIAAYTKAGFDILADFQGRTGDTLLMQYRP